MIPKLIFKLGSLEVYSIQAPPTFFRPEGGIDQYYWKDNASPQGYGPFESIYNAVKHYEQMITAIKSSKKDKQGHIIRVDFIRKRKQDI